MTQQSLHNAALHYLERYASSADNLRRVLMRRVRRSALVHDTDPEEGARLIDELVTRFEAAGLLDDRAYAAARVTSLRRRGASSRAIAMGLRQKGVAAPDIAAALAEHEAEVENETWSSSPPAVWPSAAASARFGRPTRSAISANATSPPWPAPASPMTSPGG